MGERLITVKKIAKQVIEEYGYPNNFLKIIFDCCLDKKISKESCYDFDDEMDELKTLVKNAQSIIIEVMLAGQARFIEEISRVNGDQSNIKLMAKMAMSAISQAMIEEQKKSQDFLDKISSRVYYLKDFN